MILLRPDIIRSGLLFMISALVVLNLLDFATTYVIIEKMDGHELNPFLVYLMDVTDSIWIILVVKILGLSVLGSMIYDKWAKIQRPVIFWTFAAATLAYLMVVLSNSFIIFYFWGS